VAARQARTQGGAQRAACGKTQAAEIEAISGHRWLIAASKMCVVVAPCFPQEGTAPCMCYQFFFTPNLII
jgi:hypothetical protein